MVVQNNSISDVIETSNSNQSIEGSIPISAMGKIIEMISNNAYAYPIPSILREITSNGFDTHVKANVFDNVVINIVETEDEMFVEFTDKGTGMSPDVIKNVYMKWGVSQSSGSNDFIGGWGLGSKSPFSYTDFFEIITISDNIEYTYYFHNQSRDVYGNKKFTLDLVSESKVSKSNGTTIKITIKTTEDLTSFLMNIRTQLSYFNNLTVNINIRNTIIDREIVTGYGLNNFNSEKILEYKTFKYRLPFGDTYNYYSSGNKIQRINNTNGMFILIDSVAYPFDYKQCSEFIKNYSEDFFVGLKFNIGELDVTINREAINYTQKTKEVIEERFIEFTKEIAELYIKQHIQIEKNYKIFLQNENKGLRLGLKEDVIEIKVNSFVYTYHEFSKKYYHLPDLKIFKANATCLKVIYNFIGRITDDMVINYSENDDSVIVSLFRDSYFNQQKEVLNVNSTVRLIDKTSELIKLKNFYSPHNTVIVQRISKEGKKINFINYCNRNNVNYAKKLKPYDNFSIEQNNYKPISFYVKLDDDLINPYLYSVYNNITVYKGKKIKHVVRKVPILGKAVELFKMIKHFKSCIVDVADYSDIEITTDMEHDYKEYIREKNPQYKRKKEERIIIYDDYSQEVSIDTVLAKADKLMILIKQNKKIDRNKTIMTKYTDKCFIKKLINKIDKKRTNNVSYAIIELSETAYKSLERGIKKRLSLKLISVNPIVKIDEFYQLKYVRNFILRYSFYTKLKNTLNVFNTSEAIIKSTSNYLRQLYKNGYDDFVNSVDKMYNCTTNDYVFRDTMNDYFLSSEEEQNSIYSIMLAKKKLAEYKRKINFVVEKNPILSYLNINTPKKLVNPLIKCLTKMDYFYEKPIVILLSDNITIEESLVLLF